MNNGIILIIGMATVTIGSSVAQKIMTASGKMDEAAWLDLSTKSLLACTAITTFVTFIKALKNLG